MTPAEFAARVARKEAALLASHHNLEGLPVTWARYCLGLLIRNAMIRADHDSDTEEVLLAVAERLGLVEDAG